MKLKKGFRNVFLFSSFLTVSIIAVPTIIVVPYIQNDIEKELNLVETKKEVKQSGIVIQVERSKNKKVEKIPLEEYVFGVVASEMPANFEIEALKAQAIASRTYIMKLYMTNKNVVITDTVNHQVYKDREELKKIWGNQYNERVKKITKAINETVGQVITYDDELISALFFSTSNGYTENSEEYWTNKLPYLRSVESPWDKQSPKFNSQKVMNVRDFCKALSVPYEQAKDDIKIMKRTSGNRVEEVRVGNITFSGKEIRTFLKLASSDFSISRQGEQLTIDVKGYGHGVGMSQYGANGLALEGKTALNILQYYYQGTKISQIESNVTAASVQEKEK